ALLQQRVELALELVGLRGRAPAHVRVVGVAREELREVGAPALVAGTRRELVGERFVVGEPEAPRTLRRPLVELERAGALAALPRELRFDQQDLRLDVRGAVTLPAPQQPEVAPHPCGAAGGYVALRAAPAGAQVDQALGEPQHRPQRRA